MPQFDQITLETPLFSIQTYRGNYDDYFNLTPVSLTFKDAQLYSLFKKFMDESTLVNSSESLTKYIAEFDDNTKTVVMGERHGKQNIIGKFFLETNLDWPELYYEAKNYFIPEYKQPVVASGSEEEYGKGVLVVALGRQGLADIPVSVIKSLNSFGKNDYLKQVAPLIVQAYRTSPLSEFRFFKQDAILTEIACQLNTTLDKPQAALYLKNEITNSQIFYTNMRPFSFKKDEINFTTRHGTHVNIDASASFINWLFQFDIGKPVEFANGYFVFKKSEHVISFNKGPGTFGIEIRNKGIYCFVCNNQKADFNHGKEFIDEIMAGRKANLIEALTQLYSMAFNQANPIIIKSPEPSIQVATENNSDSRLNCMAA